MWLSGDGIVVSTPRVHNDEICLIDLRNAMDTNADSRKVKSLSQNVIEGPG
jgi:hypothetical protein